MKAKIEWKGMLSILLCCVLMLGLMPVTAFANTQPSFSGGSGTETDPWLISSAEDLIALSTFINNGDATDYDADDCGAGNFCGYYFKQTCNIDLTDKAWKPIGYSGDMGLYFSGNYDGDGYTISNTTSTGKNDDYGYATAGIFGWVYFGSVSNLNVDHADFTATGQSAYSFVGGIVGVAYGASITNCSVTDSTLESLRTPWNNNCAGGIAGYSTGSAFEKCASVQNKVKAQAYGGGFVGELDDDYGVGTSSFTNCYVAKCNITAFSSDFRDTNSVGGFAGEATASDLTITNCYVFDTKITIGQGSASRYPFQGVFAGNLWGSSSTIDDTNCYYGGCGEVSNNTGTAAEKTSSEFADGTVTALLGSTYMQGAAYPIFYGPANYSAVDTAIAKANALNKDYYKDFSAVDAVINAVVRGKNATERAAVNAMAQAIETAIADLEYKDADYSNVNEAIAKANVLNKSDYKNFSAVEAAINAVVRGKNITEQAVVDAMAQDIEDAIKGLEKKEPVTPTNPTTDTQSPQTGDNSNMFLWTALLFISCFGTVGTAVYGKRKRAK